MKLEQSLREIYEKSREYLGCVIGCTGTGDEFYLCVVMKPQLLYCFLYSTVVLNSWHNVTHNMHVIQQHQYKGLLLQSLGYVVITVKI